MAEKLADLVLRIRADSRQLQRELGSVEARNRRATRNVSKQWSTASTGIAGAARQLSRFTGLGAALGAGFSIVGIKGQIDDMLALSDSVDKTSQRLGLGTDALQEFRFAADQSGVAARTLDLAIQRFTRRAGEAANGTGEAKDAIKELRLELRGADGQIRKTEDLFTDAVNALAGIENPAERLRLAFKLFDSEGVSVLQLVDDFEALRQEARDLGVVIDASMIQKAVKAKDQLAALSKVTQAELAPALLELTPVILGISGAFVTAAKATRGFFDSFVGEGDESERELGIRLERAQRRVQGLIETLKKEQQPKSPFKQFLSNFKDGTGALPPVTLDEIARAQAAVFDLEEKLRAVRSDLAAANTDSSLGAGGIDPAVFGATRKAIESVEAQISGFERLRSVRSDAEAEKRIAEIIEIENKARTANVDLTTEQGQRYLELSQVLAGLTDDAASYSEAQQNVNRILLAGRTPAQVLSEDIARLREDFAEGRISADALSASMDSLNSKFEESRRKSEKESRTYFDELGGLGDAFVGNFSRSMADMLLTGELTFKSLAESFARDFIAASIQATITGGIASLFGSVSGGAGGGLFSGLFGGGRADGGPIKAGVPYLVGERGPELIVPRASGFVVPNGSLRTPSPVGALAPPSQAVAPPAAVSVTVINETDGTASVSERTGPSGQREITVLVTQMVSGDISRGGPIARAMEARLQQRPRGA